MRPDSAPDFSRHVHCLLGLPFDITGLAGAVAQVEHAVRDRKPLFISTPNLNFLIASQTDASFRDSVIHSELSLADGMPVVWLARLLNIPISERVAGSTLFEALLKRSASPQTPQVLVYFFGGPDGVAETAGHCINQKSADSMRCVGTQSPGFGTVQDMSDEATLSHINSSGADFVVVSLGARKGQEWIERNRDSLQAPVISHLGAVVNMVAGTIQRAPHWMQRSGLEWLWRIKEEPALWQRYCNDGYILLKLIFTRVLPLWWISHNYKHSSLNSSSANVTEDINKKELLIELAGEWTNENAEKLGILFEYATRQSRGIKILMKNVSFVDSAFIGKTMLLQDYQNRKGLHFSLVETPRHIENILTLSCASYIINSEIN